MSTHYDLIIVGAGPAGLMAAKTAGENCLKVALAYRHGSCQETVLLPSCFGQPGMGLDRRPRQHVSMCKPDAQGTKKIDPDCVIMIDMAGRAGLFLVAAAILLGLIGARVGMEDALYMYPHKGQMIKNNAFLVRQVVAMVEALGRRVGTADDYRRFIGIDNLKK